MTDRILWHRRPIGNDLGDIDEIVMHDVNVHIEQMDDRCWWIGIWRGDGTEVEWMGVFTATSRGRMQFTETGNIGVVWDVDDTHEVTP